MKNNLDRHLNFLAATILALLTCPVIKIFFSENQMIYLSIDAEFNAE